MAMNQQLRISALQAPHVTGVIQLSRCLEKDSVPCSFWRLDTLAVDQLLRHSHKWTLVALLDTVTVGIGTLTRGTLYQRHLGEVSVAVHPEYRRIGIAQALVQSLEALAHAQHIELLKALIWTKNTPSRHLFESLNFEHKATLYCEFKSDEFGEIDDCVYYKRLSL